MRILHTSSIPSTSPGILNQLCAESDAARKLGIPWETALVTSQGINVGAELCTTSENPPEKAARKQLSDRLQNYAQVRRIFYDWLHDIHGDYDLILLRYLVHDRTLGTFARNSRVPVMTVHHTLEVEELATDGPLGILRASSERIIGPRNLRQMAGIVGVTNEIVSYEISRAAAPGLRGFLYPNGISGELTPVLDERQETMELMFVASDFAPWHGMDLLLESMALNSDDFVLHVVGNLPARDKEFAGSDSRVVLHGRKNREEMRHLAARCWLGITSLALHRKRMEEACSLKVREYLSMGLPAYGAYRETLPADFPFYVEREPDVSEILQAARRFSSTSRTEVHDASLPYVSKERLLRKLYEELLHL